MTATQWLKQAEADLSAGGIWGARLDAQLILAHVLAKPKEWLLAHSETDVDDHLPELQRLIKRRLNHEPVVHLTGKKEFYGLEFEITPEVLTPRAETEPMVEWAIKHLPEHSRVIDLGTGSGALIIALGKHRPDLELVATDISAEALDIAARNASRHNLNITFVQSDIWSGVPGKFDAILTNLPYLQDGADLTEEVKKEPPVALFGGQDGLDLYRRMLRGTPDHLTEEGLLFTECDPWQQDSLKAAAGKYGFYQIEESYFVMGFKKKKQSN